MECNITSYIKKTKQNRILKEFYYLGLKGTEAVQNEMRLLEPQISADKS